MRSLIAALRTLVLPFGQTTGRRIVIDGVNGTITIYDANDNERIVLGGPVDTDLIKLSTGDVDEGSAGNIGSTTSGDISERLALQSPDFANNPGDVAILRLASGSKDGTIGNAIQLVTDDVLLNGVSLPRGTVVAPAKRTTNLTFGAVTGTETDVVTLAEATLVSGRRYKLSFTWEGVVWNTAAANVIFVVRLKETGGTQFMESAQLATGTTGREGNSTYVTLNCPSEIAAGEWTFKAVAARLTGSGTLDLQAGATFPATLLLEDIGAS
jgi:hypothetical protein